MRATRTIETNRSRAVALITAVATAAVLALPTAAAAWPQVGADGAGTYQAAESGPADPGLKWISDVSDDVGDAAPDGFSFGRNTLPIIGADGTIMRRAGADGQNVGQGNSHIVGIDPADGSLAWNIPFALNSCDPAVDSDGRGWAVFIDGTDGEPMLQAFDTATGVRTDGTELDPLPDSPGGVNNRWCQNIGLHIGGTGDNERAILYQGSGSISEGTAGILAVDISGGQATTAWVIDPADAPFDRVQRDRQNRLGATTDDHLYVPTVTDGQFALTEISLATGGVTNSVDLPTFDEDGASAAMTGRATTSVLIDGSTAVVSYQGGTGALSAVNLTTFQVSWTQPFDDVVTQQRGPATLALSDGNVISSSGAAPDRLYAHSVTTGDPTSWSTDSGVRAGREPGQYLTDTDGTIYVNTQGPDGGRLDQSVTALSADGSQQWRFNRAGLMDATGLSDNGLSNTLSLSVIDADGTLYLTGDDQVIAIDGSGGLAIRASFPDVNPNSVHAANIDRLVQRGITTGDTAGNYNPGGPVTRAQFATFLVRALGEESFPSETFFPSDTFIDVDPDSVHAPSIYAVAEAGITTGVTADTFAPNQPLPRDQMATLLVRAFGEEVFPSDIFFPSGIFTDVDPDSVHADNIGIVAEVGVTTGRTADTFDPGGTVFRDQMASFLMRTIDLREEFIQPEDGGEDLF